MKPLYLRRHRVLPPTKRIESNYLLAFAIVLGLLAWMVFKA